MSDRTELLEQAEKLGLEFPKNIPTEKLLTMVEDALENMPMSKEDAEMKRKEEAAEEKAAKEEAEAQAQLEEAVKKSQSSSNTENSRRTKLLQRVAEAKKKAFKTRIVTLTNRDNRENDVMTTAHLSFENQHFGLSKIVPLDVPVELEQALIDIAESTHITLHKDEIVNGKRTGNKVNVSVKKYAVSYSNKQTGE